LADFKSLTKASSISLGKENITEAEKVASDKEIDYLLYL
jgi:hypothetical protein